jgi:hypothetical protein
MFHGYSGMPAFVISLQPLATCVALNAPNVSSAVVISIARCWFFDSSSSIASASTRSRPWMPPSSLR